MGKEDICQFWEDLLNDLFTPIGLI